MIGLNKIIPTIKNPRIWYVILFLSYILSGQLLSAISFQSQVIPIWIPAGIGLVGCYLWWWRFFPAVFFASFIFNFSIIPNVEFSHIYSIVGIQNSIIAIGSMLQAIVGAGILRYWLGNPFEQWQNSKTIYFMFIVGILVNLIASSIGVYSLSIFNPLYSLDDFQLNMIYWWLGDSLGVMFFTSFFFSINNFRYLKVEHRKTKITILSSVIVLFTVTILITQFFVTKLSINSHEFVNKEVKMIENGIHRQINGGISQLRDLATFIQNTPNVSKESFHQYVSNFYKNSASIKAMSWNPIITEQQKILHENELIQIYSNDTSIKGKPILENDPIIYIKLISPEKGNEKAVGFNVYSNPSRKQTLKSAMESYQPKATPIIQLVQSDKKEPAFLLFYPVFEQPNTKEGEINKRLKGFATAVF
jgi:CHASE1-domain containing sensor protein